MKNKLIKSSVWYTISNFLLNSVSIITTPIFTRVLSLEEYGLFNNFLSIYSILSVVITLNLQSTLIRARYDFENDKKSYTTNLIYISFFVTFFCIIISNCFFKYIEQYLAIDRFMMNMMFITFLFLPAINIFQVWQRIDFQYKKSVLISFLISIGNVALSLLLVFIMDNKLYGRILGTLLPTIFIGMIITFYYFHNSRTFNSLYIKYALKICLPYIPHLLSLNVLNALDKMMITKMCGEEFNALYSIAVSCGLIVTILINALNSSFSPWLGDQLHYKNYSKIRKVSYIYIFIFVIFAIANMLFAPEILLILGGESYIDAITLIPVIVAGGVCQLLYTMYVNIEQFEKRTIGMAIASCIAALLNFVLNFICINCFGYQAAAYTTFLSYLFLLIFHFLLVKRINLTFVYDTRYIICVIGFIVIFMLISQILYKLILIRLIFIMIFFLLIAFLFVYVLKNKDHFNYIKE